MNEMMNREVFFQIYHNLRENFLSLSYTLQRFLLFLFEKIILSKTDDNYDFFSNKRD